MLYLCRAVNEFFRARVEPDQVVWAFAGVRSLYDDGKGKVEDVTREYHLELDERYRHRAAAHRLWRQDHDLSAAGRGRARHDRAFLPVAPALDRDRAAAGRRFPLERGRGARGAGAQRLAVPGGGRRRGGWSAPTARGSTASWATPSGATTSAPFFGPLSAAEVRYLMKHEWARTADDVLWRRSKLGLKMTATEKASLANFMAGETPP